MTERIRSILGKLQAKTVLTVDELSELQTHVDNLESRTSNVPHHETHSTPGSHFTFHHAVAIETEGILERKGRPG